MSHEDAVVKLPNNFKKSLTQKTQNLQLLKILKKKIYGIQFHPEITHTLMEKKYLKIFYF